MTKYEDFSDAHVRVFSLEAEEVGKIIDKGKPLSGDELEKRGADEVLSGPTFDRLDPDRPVAREIPAPAALGELVFPGVIRAPRFICFCIGYVWCLVWINGRLRYVLKCRYWCIPVFTISTAG